MAFVTFDQLVREASTLTEGHVKIAKSLTGEKDLFLSHSQHDEEKHVRGAMAILEHHGAKVYVDVFDTTISAMNEQERPDHVRSVIQRCRRLVVLFSENTKSSRWIPWELGLRDGTININQVATFPTAQSEIEQPWGTQEYFGLYSQIRYLRHPNQGTSGYVVINPRTGRYSPLAMWLRS